jgi:hypothetical protein
MTGRPVRLFTAAAFAAAASLLSATTASACYGGCGFGYAGPVTHSYPAAAPVSYGSCVNPCGYGYVSPMYVVNHGPIYTAPVIGTPAPCCGYAGGYPYIGAARSHTKRPGVRGDLRGQLAYRG